MEGLIYFIILMHKAGKISGATVFTTESRIGQSSSRHKHVDEGKADLNLTLKLLQQRVNALEQDSSRFNVAFIHLQGERKGNLT